MLTVIEVAELLKVHPRTVRRWIAAGKLKVQRIPGRGRTGIEYRISKADFEQFLSEQSWSKRGTND